MSSSWRRWWWWWSSRTCLWSSFCRLGSKDFQVFHDRRMNESRAANPITNIFSWGSMFPNSGALFTLTLSNFLLELWSFGSHWMGLVELVVRTHTSTKWRVVSAECCEVNWFGPIPSIVYQTIRSWHQIVSSAICRAERERESKNAGIAAKNAIPLTPRWLLEIRHVLCGGTEVVVLCLVSWGLKTDHLLENSLGFGAQKAQLAFSSHLYFQLDRQTMMTLFVAISWATMLATRLVGWLVSWHLARLQASKGFQLAACTPEQKPFYGVSKLNEPNHQRLLSERRTCQKDHVLLKSVKVYPITLV